MRWILPLLLLACPLYAENGMLQESFERIRGALHGFSPRPRKRPFERFSFAVITDLQTGEGHDDFGSAGYDDALASIPEEDVRIQRIRAAILKVNALTGSENVKFVFVAGDITNSAERSEYQAAKRLLDELTVPYFPTIGNHDIWPYVWKGAEAPGPTGKGYFDEVFGDYVKDLPKRFAGRIDSPDPGGYLDGGPDFVNYTFDYQGIGFIVADWNSRIPSIFGPGASPGALLHDYAGGTYRWLDALLRGKWPLDKSQVFLLQHHPFRAKMPREIAGCFSRGDTARMRDFLQERIGTPKLAAVLAGHQHRRYDGPAFDGWPELPQIETDSAKEDSSVTVVTLESPTAFSFRRY